MIQFILKLLLAGTLCVGAFLVFVHVFPIVVTILVMLGLVKLYELCRGPNRPPPGPAP